MCSADQGHSAGPAPSFAILMCNCPEFLIGEWVHVHFTLVNHVN